jgi:hypothetical protein
MTKRGPKSNRRSEAGHETGDSRSVFVYNSPMSGENRSSILLAPGRLGCLTIPNRFVRSATQDYMARDDGEVTDRQVGLFRALAEGEVGLIITGHAYVWARPDRTSSPFSTTGSSRDSRASPKPCMAAPPRSLFSSRTPGARRRRDMPAERLCLLPPCPIRCQGSPRGK